MEIEEGPPDFPEWHLEVIQGCHGLEDALPQLHLAARFNRGVVRDAQFEVAVGENRVQGVVEVVERHIPALRFQRGPRAVESDQMGVVREAIRELNYPIASEPDELDVQLSF